MPNYSSLSRALPAMLVLLIACNGDPSGPGSDALFRWTFGEDLEGWSAGTDQSGGWGDVALSNNDSQDDPADEDDGSVKLDGTGDPGEPNAWIFRTVSLPADARTLSYWAAGHNRDGADSHLRVRLVEGTGASHTLADWEVFSGSEGVHDWEQRSVSIAAYAGQTVSLYFE
jgi:hypothetical protein